MSKSTKKVTPFRIVGQLVGLTIKEGTKIKYLRVAIANREYWFKPSKDVRQNFETVIVPGVWLEIFGYSQMGKSGKLKLKAEQVKLTGTPTVEEIPDIASTPAIKENVCILMCQKSDCWKRGGKQVYQTLEANLAEQGLREQVKIKKTGCLKQCKKGPNLVILPDKARYSRVKPQDVPELIHKHLANS